VTSAISTRGLVKRFGPIAAVDGLDLEVPRGVVYGFLGPNGAGKTTTLHILLGLLRPDSGHAEVLGLDVPRRALDVRRRAGVLLEHDGVYERLTALENLDVFGRFHGLSWGSRQARARHLLRDLNLYDRRHELAGKLSRGMKRKLAIARALLPEPELVILDEPTVGLDPRTVVEIRERLRSLTRDEGATVFLTTHNLVEAERVADQVGVVMAGRLVSTGRPADLAREHGATRLLVLGSGFTPAVVQAAARLPDVIGVEVQGAGDTLRLRLSRNAAAADILATVVEAGGEVEATERHEESLEEIFLALTRDGAGGGAA
jgi:ABC-2 type transport system ATP-binding protein